MRTWGGYPKSDLLHVIIPANCNTSRQYVMLRYSASHCILYDSHCRFPMCRDEGQSTYLRLSKQAGKLYVATNNNHNNKH